MSDAEVRGSKVRGGEGTVVKEAAEFEVPDEEVEAVYAKLNEECSEARSKRYIVIVAGDVNARVGARGDFDDASVIGHSPAERRNARGGMLLL